MNLLARTAAIAGMLLLGACVSVPIELKVNPTLAAEGARFSTIQFSHNDREKVFRVLREFAAERKMETLPADGSILGPGWTQTSYQLRVRVKGVLYDSEYLIRLTLLYKDGNATVQLLHARETQNESAQLELALLDTLRSHFGATVVRIGG